LNLKKNFLWYKSLNFFCYCCVGSILFISSFYNEGANVWYVFNWFLLWLSYPVRFYSIQLSIKISVTVILFNNLQYNQREFQLYSYACVYWNVSTKDWDTYGCYKDTSIDGFLGCYCNHTTNFAVLMVRLQWTLSRQEFSLCTNLVCANWR
jgi:hypothetical protein